MPRRTQFWKDVVVHALSGAATDRLTPADPASDLPSRQGPGHARRGGSSACGGSETPRDGESVITAGDLVRWGSSLGVMGIDLEQRVCGCGAEQYIATVTFHTGTTDQDGVLGKVREVIEARVPAACDVEVRSAFVAEGTVKA